MKKEIRRELIESAKDFMYYGYGLKSFLEYDSFKAIDENELRSIWKDAFKELTNN